MVKYNYKHPAGQGRYRYRHPLFCDEIVTCQADIVCGIGYGYLTLYIHKKLYFFTY